MPCVSKPGCTHGIIVSIWLICYIQCGFSISYLSIPGIVAHDRCNISQIFIFFVQFQCPMSCCAFHLYNCFSGGFKTGQRGRKVGGQECWVIIIYSKTLACLISFSALGLLSSLFILRFIIIIISIYIIIIAITIVMGIFLYIYHQYNYPNNYQIINYSFKGFLSAEQWVFFNFLSLIGPSIYFFLFVLLLTLLLLLLLLLLLS